MATEMIIDGSKSLDQIKGALEFQEQLGFLKVTNLRKGSSGTDNIGTFEDDDSGQPPPLILVQVTPAQAAPQIIATQLAQGKNLVFRSKVFVSGKEAEVLCFR